MDTVAKYYLLIDDDDICLTILEKYLKSFLKKSKVNFVINVAKSGKEAIKIISDSRYIRKYEMIITDFSMPEMNGMSTAKELQKLDPGIFIVCVTSENLNTQFLLNCLESGITKVWSKPVNKTSVKNILLEKKVSLKKNYDQTDLFTRFETLNSYRI